MPDDRMTVSVVLPVFNGERFIASAVGSVLGQTRPPDEVVVVDDGSTDGTREACRAFGDRIDLVALPHGGGARALNAGIRRATGQCIAFLDADDLWAPGKLERQADEFRRNPGIEAVFTGIAEFRDPACRVTRAGEVEVSGRTGETGKSALMVRRDALDRIGLFDEDFVADFPEWHARATRAGLRTATVKEILAYRRIHALNTSAVHAERLRRDYLRIARRMITRAGA